VVVSHHVQCECGVQQSILLPHSSAHCPRETSAEEGLEMSVQKALHTIAGRLTTGGAETLLVVSNSPSSKSRSLFISSPSTVQRQDKIRPDKEIIATPTVQREQLINGFKSLLHVFHARNDAVLGLTQQLRTSSKFRRITRAFPRMCTDVQAFIGSDAGGAGE
jgi:hypothetical protein